MGRVGVGLLVGCAIGAATVTVGSTLAVHATVVDTTVELAAGDSERSGPATTNPDDGDDSQVVEATLPGSSETDEPVAVTAEDDDSETLAIIALVVAVIGLVVAVAGVLLARRRQPPDAGPG